MRNQSFVELLGALNTTAPITESALLNALYVMRAHRNLAGLIPIAQRLTDLSCQYSALRDLIDDYDGGESFGVLERVGCVRTENPVLLGNTIQNNNRLRPFSGDSCVADLLLIQPDHDDVPGELWERVLAWYCYQSIKFNRLTLDPVQYRRYLEDDKLRLRLMPHGSRLYNSFLRVRWLADRRLRDQLEHMAQLPLSLDESTSRALAIGSRISSLSRRNWPNLKAHVEREYGAKAYSYASNMLNQHGGVESELGLMLATLYLPDFSPDQQVGPGGGGGGYRHGPNVARSKYLTAVTADIVADGVHRGIVIDVYPRIDAQSDEVAIDDADTRETGEPAVTVFLSDSPDLLKAYYATRALQHQIEHSNAALPWTSRSLSVEAIDEVLALIRYDQTEEELVRLARLAIGLSLISGRPLEEVARPVISDGSPALTERQRVGINRHGHTLVVLSARPELSTSKQAVFCHRIASRAELILPAAWSALINSVADHDTRSGVAVVRRARGLLGRCDPAHEVTPGRLSLALRRHLIREAGGDLAVYKIVTDRTEVNLNNLVHYASYDDTQIDRLWSRAVDRLVGLARPAGAPRRGRGRLGATDCFKLSELGAHIRALRQRVIEAHAQGDSVETFNSLNLFVAQWLGVATAGRKTRCPVPAVILGGAQPWALIQDKHREDGSTDRLLPLSATLMTQLQYFLAYTSSVALMDPSIEPLVDSHGGLTIQLRRIDENGAVVDYRPKYQEDLNGRWLPANWPRKLIRSESSALCGRYRDTGLGHWVRGRNPWRQTASFKPMEFRHEWLELQNRLEAQLGFEPIGLPPTETGRRAPLAGPVRREPVPSPEEPVPAYTNADLEMIMQETDAKCDHAIQSPEPSPSAALQLVKKAISKPELAADGEARAELAIALCDRIRSLTRVPLFAVRPRRRFSQDWMPDEGGLRALAMYERDIEPLFRRDLTRLPEPEDTSDAVELGRWLMVVIWRLGLTHWPLLAECCRSLVRHPTLLAVGDLRYLCIRVPHALTREPMRRTVLFDDGTAAYWVAERDRLLPLLQKMSEQSANRRRSHAERALRDYQSSLGVTTTLKLTQMTAAATQSLMLRAGPLVAAYAPGRLFTADLDDTELRRLAGLTPYRSGRDNIEMPLLFDEKPGVDLEKLPQDLQLQAAHWFNQLVRRRSPYKVEWLRAIEAIEPANGVEQLLRGYAIWLVRRNMEERPEARFTAVDRNRLVSRLQVVGHALFGNADAQSDSLRIDEDVLESLQELSAEHFPERAHHGAWYRFHAYLRDPEADTGQIEIGRLGANVEHAVSARIMSVAEQGRISAILQSARSGIGKPGRRRTAWQVFDLIRNFGLRRSEAEKTREADHQSDLLWVRPYDDHGLKTAWARRGLPLAFASASTREWLECQVEKKRGGCLVDDEQGQGLDPAIYDQVNQAIKGVTGDRNLGLHHLRHTVASSLTLTLMAEGVCLDGLYLDMPWLAHLLIDRERMDGLLDGEPDGGQGLQVVSALLGHSHPTTTLRHYVHVMFVLLHAAQRRDDELDITRTLENRMASRSTAQRMATAARKSAAAAGASGDKAFMARVIRDALETRDPAAIDHDDTPIRIDLEVEEGTGGSSEPVSAMIHFGVLERCERALWEDDSAIPADQLAQLRAGLVALGALPTGKRGSPERRHPMARIETQPVPARIAAGQATRAADALCQWLEYLRVNAPADFGWLLAKWVHTCESERGRMRLDGDEEVERAQRFHASARVWLEVSVAPHTASRSSATGGVRRMRIRCGTQSGQPLRRDTGAVRWVMSYCAALWFEFGDRPAS